MIKKLLSLAVSITMFVLGASAQSPTAPALGFNAFLQNNATLTTNESEGPIAIGGDLTVAGNYQVNIHNNGTFTVSSVPIGLFVGGKVNLSSGSLQVNSGRYVKIGNCSGSNIKTWYRDNNNASSNIYITGSSASYASTPNININSNAFAWGTEVSASNNPVCDANTSTEINFSTAFTSLKASATSLAACTSTPNILSNPNQDKHSSECGEVLTSGQIKITLASGTNVLNITGSDLNSVTNGITFTNSPDASHVLVINVNASGSFTWNVWNQGGISGNNAPYIIYNFYNTSSLNIAGNSTIEGTVFAPNAEITKTVNQANIEGQVIGKSFSQSGGELHYYPFSPSVTGCAVACSATSSTTNASFCDGSSYAFNGTSYGAAGTYTAHLTNAAGCDSAVTLVLTKKLKSTSSTLVSVCSLPYVWNGTSYNAAGSYTIHLTNASGCDSAATLVLTLKSATSSTTNASFCDGGSYTFNGTTYSTAGTYTAHLTNAAGCDSTATLVLSKKSKSSSTTNASFCDGGSYTFNGTIYSTAGTYSAHLTNAAGCDSTATLVLSKKSKSSSTTNASFCDGGSYTFNGTVCSSAGTYTAHLTNAAGCDSTATLVLTFNPLPSVAPIVGTDTICATTTTSLSNATLGGVWASSNNSVATVDASGTVTAIADGKANITYTVTNGTCSATATLAFVVSCDTGSVTSGGTGGLESKPLGSAIGTRNFNLYKNGQNGAVQYTAAEQIMAPKKGSISTFGISAKTLYSVMPYQVNSAYTAYDKSAAVADLTSITNAIDVRTIDFTLNNSPKAVAFATKTIGGIYSHTKPICDRLKGAQLLNIENVQIANLPFIRYTILQADGSKEYAVSFSAGQKAGRNTYSLQSNWLMPDYISEDTMVNYQLWASTPTDVTTMVKEILSRLQATMPVSELSNGNDLPSAYVSAANRKDANLTLTINNRTANTSGYFTLTQHATENTTIDNKVIVPFTIGANGKSTVSIPVGDTYDANISMVFNNTTTDMLYIADGIWGTSGDNNTSVAQFNVANNSSRVASTDEYALLRDVKVQVTTPSYVSVYKYLRGGASAVNLSGYKSFKFTANTNTEGLNIKITITKEGVNNWKSQYTYYITGLQDGQTYQIGTSEFKSTDNSLPATMDLSDVTSVVYNIENPTGQAISFNAGISNAAFSKVDIAYERSLQAKAVGISPNPSNGNFRVSFASPAAAMLKLMIIDNLGRVVSTKQVSATQGNNTVSVSLNETLKKGLYFVSLQGAGMRYDTQKVMFQGK